MADLMVDIDDVVFPLIDSIHRIAQERGLHDGSEPANNWCGWEQYDCSEKEYWALWDEFTELDGYLTTKPIEGAVEALRWLMWEGHRIHIVTARGFMKNSERIRLWTPQWLEEFGVPHETLTFAQDKAQAMIDLDVTFAAGIDDSPKNFEKLQDAGVRMYLQNHGHNEWFTAPPGRRVDTLWEWAYRLEKDLA